MYPYCSRLMKCIRDDVMWDNVIYLTFHTNFTIAAGGGTYSSCYG